MIFVPVHRKKRPTSVVLGGLIIIALILGILLFRSGTLSLPNVLTKPTSMTVDGIVVKTSLSKPIITTAIHFLKEALPAERLPKDLTFQFDQKGNAVKGDSYIGNWRKDTMSLSLLVGLDRANKTVMYLRVWTMDTAKPLSDKEFSQLPTKIFAQSYLERVGPVVCEKWDSITVCPKMTSIADGSIRGITVRSPITLTPPPDTTPPPGTPPPPTVTVLSACLVSKETSTVYPDNSCL